jgi:hypothetical protein
MKWVTRTRRAPWCERYAKQRAISHAERRSAPNRPDISN